MSAPAPRGLRSRALLRASEVLADASAALLFRANRGRHGGSTDDPCPDTPLSDLVLHSLFRSVEKAVEDRAPATVSWALLLLRLGSTSAPDSPLRHLVTQDPRDIARALRDGRVRVEIVDQPLTAAQDSAR